MKIQRFKYKGSVILKEVLYLLVFSNFPNKEFSFLIAHRQNRSIIKFHNIHTEEFTLKSMTIVTHLGFLAAMGADRSNKFQARTYWSSEHVKARLFLETFTSFTDAVWTLWLAQTSFGLRASNILRFPESVTYIIWLWLFKFQHALW